MNSIETNWMGLLKGILKNLWGIFNTKALGESIVEAILASYFANKKLNPELNEHLLLAKVFVERAKLFAKIHSLTMGDEKAFMAHAIKETTLMSVLDPPASAKALGLYTLSRERPDIFEKHPEFLLEYQQLMKPAMDAYSLGKFWELYNKKNPEMK